MLHAYYQSVVTGAKNVANADMHEMVDCTTQRHSTSSTYTSPHPTSTKRPSTPDHPSPTPSVPSKNSPPSLSLALLGRPTNHSMTCSFVSSGAKSAYVSTVPRLFFLRILPFTAHSRRSFSGPGWTSTLARCYSSRYLGASDNLCGQDRGRDHWQMANRDTLESTRYLCLLQ